MSRRRISETLFSDAGQICCVRCEHQISSANESWKEKAALSEIPVASLAGAGLGIEPSVVVRNFACPSCGGLLDAETALPGDPFLQDVVTG